MRWMQRQPYISCKREQTYECTNGKNGMAKCETPGMYIDMLAKEW